MRGRGRPSGDGGLRLALVRFGPITRVPIAGHAVRAQFVTTQLEQRGVLAAVLSLEPRNFRQDELPPIGFSERKAHDSVAFHRIPRRDYGVWLAQLAICGRRIAPLVDGFVVESAMLGVPLLATGRPIVWDTTELETLHYRRLQRTMRSTVKGVIWRLLEALMVRTSRVVIAISEEEAAHWRRIFPAVAAKLVVCDHAPMIDTAIDGRSGDQPPGTAATRPSQHGAPHVTMAGRPPTSAERYVLFLGSLGAKHNVDAARWTATELRSVLPTEVTIVLAGAGTSELVAELGTPEQVKAMGFVDDVDALIRRAELFLAPLAAGAGVKTKVLHALALGQRVVGTAVAFEGIRNAPGCVEERLEALSTTVRLLLEHPESEAERVVRQDAQAAWAKVQFDSRRLDEQWDEVLSRVPQRNRG